MNPRDSVQVLRGFEWRMEQNQGMAYQIMVLIRWVGAILVNQNAKSKAQQKSPEKLFRLPFEKKEKKDIEELKPTKEGDRRRRRKFRGGRNIGQATLSDLKGNG